MSAVCPNCGSADTRRRSGSKRACRSCGTRFTPPTPLWERLIFAALFLVPAVVIGIIGIGFILLPLGNGGVNPGAVRGGLGCGGLLVTLAALCLVQGFRELAGRAKRPAEESDADSAGEILEVIDRDIADGAPPLVPQEEAESLLREIAEKYKVKGISRKLGNFRDDHLANAAARFAKDMEDDETPLALIDSSFLKNGKAGFLLTNRALYSSFSRRPFWLADIEEVSDARPGVGDYFAMWFLGVLIYGLLYGFRSLQYRLLVNGKIVYAGPTRLRGDFWIELLTELAEAARQAADSSGDIKAAPSIVVVEIARSRQEGEPIEFQQIRNPSWPQIEQSIRDLDQNSHPSLRIWAGEVEQAPALDILGGNGKYVLRELGDGWIYYDPSQSEEEIEVCTGLPGHRAPAFYVCTDLDRVLEIARHYFETGTPE